MERIARSLVTAEAQQKNVGNLRLLTEILKTVARQQQLQKKLGCRLFCWLGEDAHGLFPAFNHILVDHDLAHAMHRRKFKHCVEQDRLVGKPPVAIATAHAII